MAQHLERMVRGADFLKIKLPFTPKELHRFAEELIEKNNQPDAVLRVTLTRGSGERGYTPKNCGPATLVMSLHPVPPLDPKSAVKCSLVTSAHRIPASEAGSSFKTTNKLLQVVARLDAEARGADEALLLNSNGEVAEAGAANLFWVYHEKICTVPTGRGVLPGITRAVVLEICQTLGFQTNKRVIKPEALRSADGIFLTQSVQGIVEVVTFDGEPVSRSPLVEKIHRSYCDMLAKE
jgi:branched-subunit amino acid aminotransferase/4-amino-4-deoxychorismate lyase